MAIIPTSLTLPSHRQSPVTPRPRRADILDMIAAQHDLMPSILDMRLHEWVRKLTSPDGGPFPHGIGPKQLEALAQAQCSAATARGRRARPPWRGPNHLSALLSNEVRAGRITRLQKACYVGRENQECRSKFKKPLPSKPVPEPMRREANLSHCAICFRKFDDTAASIILKCKSCGVCVHAQCVYNQRRAPTKLLIPSMEWLENWHCLKCKTCNICGSAEKKEGLLCYDCDSMEHTACQPRGVDTNAFWSCSLCAKEAALQGFTNNGNVAYTSPSMQAPSVSLPIHQTPSPHIHSPFSQTPRFDQYPVQDYQMNSQNVMYNDMNGVQNDYGVQDAYLTNNCTAHQVESSSAECGKRSPGRRDTRTPLIKSTSPLSTESLMNREPIKSWSTDQLVQYFKHLGCTEGAAALEKEEIDGAALLLMQRQDVFERLGLKMGPALKTYTIVRKLQKRYNRVTKAAVTID